MSGCVSSAQQPPTSQVTVVFTLSLARRVAWNTLVQIMGRSLGLMASFAVQAILIRHLDLDGFGQFTAASAYVALFTVLGEAGLYLVSVRRASKEHERRSQILGAALSLRLMWSIPPLSLGILVVYWFALDSFATYDPVVRIVVAIFSLNAYFTLLNQFLSAIFRIHLRMDLAVLGEVSARILTLLGILLVVNFGGGLRWVAIAITCATFFNFVYAWLVGQRFEKFAPRWDPPLMRELLLEAAGLTALIVLSLLRQKIGVLLLYGLQSAADVGIYGAALRVQEVLITFAGLFVALLYPLFSRLVSENRNELHRLFQRSLDVLVVGGVGAALFVHATAQTVSTILDAPQAAEPMRLLAFGLPLVFAGMAFAHLLYAEGRHLLVVRLMLALVLLNAGANYFAIRAYSYTGAAGVAVFTELVATASMAAYWLFARRMPLKARSVLSVPWALVLAWTLRLLWVRDFWPIPQTVPAQLVQVLILGGASVLVYAAGIFAMRILPPETLRQLLSKTRRPSEGPTEAPPT